ncbi:hypothetical protein [Chamaesiphon minutus]|uniref:Uncharacterized protein n=1 Tax=Chamaesiphon minutus (strain ATCC 27169 / PCC 6605) TaxID=1173020 RepID=K9UL88_CHAP6|nr:hypothetical protein [Chamaesiphon minutus]AFY95418.1 hypothetical protein Cha6605_4489 [Chamaesiphon minutus PCC 6605]
MADYRQAAILAKKEGSPTALQMANAMLDPSSSNRQGGVRSDGFIRDSTSPNRRSSISARRLLQTLNADRAEFYARMAKEVLIIPMLALSHRKRFDSLKQGILAQFTIELTKALSMRRYPLGSNAKRATKAVAQSLRILLKCVCFLSPSLCQIGTLNILPLFAL